MSIFNLINDHCSLSDVEFDARTGNWVCGMCGAMLLTARESVTIRNQYERIALITARHIPPPKPIWRRHKLDPLYRERFSRC